MCIFVCGGMIVSKAQLFARIVLVFNLFTICWSIVTAIAVLNQDMWKYCPNDGSEGSGKYQHVRALADMRSCCGARESSTFNIAFSGCCHSSPHRHISVVFSNLRVVSAPDAKPRILAAIGRSLLHSHLTFSDALNRLLLERDAMPRLSRRASIAASDFVCFFYRHRYSTWECFHQCKYCSGFFELSVRIRSPCVKCLVFCGEHEGSDALLVGVFALRVWYLPSSTVCVVRTLGHKIACRVQGPEAQSSTNRSGFDHAGRLEVLSGLFRNSSLYMYI
jgi:hypothetical protein